MKNIILIVCFFSPSLLLAQKHDYHWQLGLSYQDNPLDSNYGTFMIDFSNLSKPKMEYNGNGLIDFNITCANMSDAEGHYIFSYNGEYIEDAKNDTMPNSIGVGKPVSSLAGDAIPQGGIILPIPESNHKYVLVHMSSHWFPAPTGLQGHEVNYSIIDMKENNGYGRVLEKRQLLIQDTLEGGQLSATRHANGRDWWVLVSKPLTNEFYRLLITPDGIQVKGKQTIGAFSHIASIGSAHFSPDGTKYAVYGAATFDEENGTFFNIYDFDRCTGLLSKEVEIQMGVLYGSVEFSPNSKILYHIAWDNIFQYDLEAEDVLASKTLVATGDDYLDTVYLDYLDTINVFGHAFWLGQLAPDGTIYISATNGFNKLIHIIHNPNVWGVGCDVEQHVHIPTFSGAIPNFPNYRLGPIDGSSCDSLGINNLPLARFRYDQETLDTMAFDFVDLSNYEPTTWAWDFGDGEMSTDTNPSHVFAQAGVYPVCLTVSNEYGTSTMCDTLYLGVVATQEAEIQVAVRVWPNPFRDYLVLSLYDYYPEDAYIYFYDVAGHFLRKQRIRYGQNEIDVSGFSRGMLFYEILDGGVRLGFGKVGAE